MTDLLFFGTVFVFCIILMIIVHRLDQINGTINLSEVKLSLLKEDIKKCREISSNLDDRLSYVHRVFFTNRHTVSTKIELIESDIHVINTILGFAPGPMQYESKDVADRRNADEGLEPRE